jgi:hypothetical protein
MADITVNGFVIVGQISPWDEPHRAEILGAMSCHTFGRTAGEAWLLVTGAPGYDGDQPMRIQRLMDRGYRLAEATLTIRAAEGE